MRSLLIRGSPSPGAIVKVIPGEEKESDTDGGEHDEIAGEYECACTPRDCLRVREDDWQAKGGNDENAGDENRGLGASVTNGKIHRDARTINS